MKRAIHISSYFQTRIGFRLLLSLAAVGLAIGPRGAYAQSAASKEYELKAAYLLNFVQFIQWPASAFADSTTPITVGVLGDDPFGAALEQTFADESVQGRKVVVKRSKQIEELKSCQLLFFSASEKSRTAEILASLGDASVVTVGETDNFAHSGGVINFYIESGKIRFEINSEAAQRKGLKISSQLLTRARIVKSDSRKG